MWFFLVFALAVGLFYAMPKPQATRSAAGIGEFRAPTAQEGREKPVLLGSKWMPSPNCLWWGDYKAYAVRKKGGKK